MEAEVLDNVEAARFLGVSPETLPQWRVRGNGPPFVRVGRRVVYRRATLERWLQEREVTSTSDSGPAAKPRT